MHAPRPSTNRKAPPSDAWTIDVFVTNPASSFRAHCATVLYDPITCTDPQLVNGPAQKQVNDFISAIITNNVTPSLEEPTS